MKHWIDRLQQERQRQACMAEIFPVLAKGLWVQLCTVIKDDLIKLRQTFPDFIPEGVQVNEKQPCSLRLSSPGYFLQLTVNITQRKLSIKQTTFVSSKTDSQESERVCDTLLDLAFDEQHQEVQFSFNEQILFLEELSELCLRPLVDLRPVPITEILGARDA